MTSWELGLYKTTELPIRMDDSETWALRADETRLEVAVIQLSRCVTGYILWDKERGDIR
jgi:hypothetical protein